MSGQQDSNLRPPAPKAGTLTGLRYAPNIVCRQVITDGIRRREGDSNPRYPCEYGSLANYWYKPLTHLSVAQKLVFQFLEVQI